MAVIGYMFSGSGYQYINMGKKIYDHMWGFRKFYDKAEKKFPEFKINKLSFIGPEEELMREENGVIICGVYQCGVYEVLKEKNIKPEQAMGFKTGELAAFISAGSLSFENALGLMAKKTEFVKKDVNRENFFHLLVNGLKTETVEKMALEINKRVKCEITSYNADDSAVVICEKKIKDKLAAIFKKAGAHIIELPYEEMSNFSLLRNAAEKMKKEFENIEFDRPNFRMLSQTKGNYYENTAEIKETLFEYIHKPARIGDALKNMLKNGVNTFVEVGPGNFMYRMGKKADRDKRILSTNDLGQIQITIKLAN
ncbi:MAG: ACP S-malonyltransferase [Candidatus Goldiibacteriota bacterium]